MNSLLQLAHLNFVTFDLLGLVMTVWMISALMDLRRRSRVSTALTCIIWACVTCLGVVGTRHELNDIRGIREQSTCEAHERLIAQAALMYASDWDEVLPGAAQWSNSHLPYMSPAKSPTIWRCPAVDQTVGYAFNRHLEGFSLSRDDDPVQLVLLQESDTCGPFSGGSPGCLPQIARHNTGDNFAFADGHVKWLIRGRAAQHGVRYEPPGLTPRTTK